MARRGSARAGLLFVYRKPETTALPRAAQSRHAAGPGQAASHIRPPFPEIPLQVNVRKDAALLSSQSGKQHLEANLDDLLGRMKSGRYFAPPVRRHYIPKADGTKRPLGIPTFEDKVAQRAIVMLLEPIYETDFLPCSYGFRPKRSAHDALNALRAGIIEQRQRWVIDADLKAYFDSISHTHLRSFLDLRIKDGVVRRMIDKWLKAGVLEEGTVHRPVAGTPQGGVISPTLSERSDN